jgi:hypothetical protein
MGDVCPSCLCDGDVCACVHSRLEVDCLSLFAVGSVCPRCVHEPKHVHLGWRGLCLTYYAPAWGGGDDE